MVTDVSVETEEEEEQPNFRMTDWPKIIEAFAEKAEEIPTMEITTIEEFT